MSAQHPISAKNSATASLQKEFYYGNDQGSSKTATVDVIDRVRTAGSIPVSPISPELFEKLYLSPEHKVHGNLRKTFANPTPLALIGFVLSLTPLSCDLMKWGGTTGTITASTGVFIAFGGLLMMLGSIGEFILGNTFPFVVFGTYSAFWFALAATFIPWFNAYGAFVPPSTPTSTMLASSDPTGNPLGLQVPAFNASFAFVFVFLSLITLIFIFGSLRTNVVEMFIFSMLEGTFSLLAGSYFNFAKAYTDPTNKLVRMRAGGMHFVAGAFGFAACMGGWYLIVAILAAELDFPWSVPVGDLSHFIRRKSPRGEVEVEERGL